MISILYSLRGVFNGSEYGRCWYTYYMHFIIMCILLLVAVGFYKYQLSQVVANTVEVLYIRGLSVYLVNQLSGKTDDEIFGSSC